MESDTSFFETFFAENKVLLLIVLAVFVWLFGRPDFWRRLFSKDDSDSAPMEESDFIAEADFFIAYGKYDEAAQALRKSIAAKPPTADLMFKLLGVYFKDSRVDDFLASATYFKREFGRHAHWEGICEMGRQLFPEERLFR